LRAVAVGQLDRKAPYAPGAAHNHHPLPCLKMTLIEQPLPGVIAPIGTAAASSKLSEAGFNARLSAWIVVLFLAVFSARSRGCWC
jgi:hypothetical protein